MRAGHLQGFKGPTGGSDEHLGNQWAVKPWPFGVKPTPRQARVPGERKLEAYI